MTFEQVTPDAAEVDALIGPSSSSALQVFVSERDGRTHVDLVGELEDATEPLFQELVAAVAPSSVGDVVLDIGLLTFVDSTGLSLFLTLHQDLASRGRQLILFDPTPMARQLLTITGLDQILQIEPDPSQD